MSTKEGRASVTKNKDREVRTRDGGPESSTSRVAKDAVSIMPTPSVPLLASSQHTAMLRRAWSLLLVEAAELSGLTPMSADEIHALAYLADCLAPIYGIPSMDGVLLRRKSGPLFPDLQWDLDRLWAMGFLELTHLTHQTVTGVVERTGYATTAAGSSRAGALQASALLDRLFTFFVALATAVARLPALIRLDAMSQDLTYASAEAVGSLITYGDWADGNPSIATADAFGGAAPLSGMTIHPWERLAMYLALLRQRLVIERQTA
jgi:hypothetical protein